MNAPDSFLWFKFAIAAAVAIITALGLGRALGAFAGKKAGVATQKAKDEIDKVRGDAKKGDDAAVLKDFEGSLPKHPLDRRNDDKRPSK